MSVIYKYALNDVKTVLSLPQGAEVLTVNEQDRTLQLWAKVDPTQQRLERRAFVVIGTGNEFDDLGLRYVSTVLVGPFVWHVFEATL